MAIWLILLESVIVVMDVLLKATPQKCRSSTNHQEQMGECRVAVGWTSRKLEAARQATLSGPISTILDNIEHKYRITQAKSHYLNA